MSNIPNHKENEDTYDTLSVGFFDPNELIGFEPDPNISSKKENLTILPHSPKSKWDRFISDSKKVVPRDKLEYSSLLKDSANDYVIKKQEDIRGKLALIYTVATFTIFLVGILICVIDGISRKVSIIDNMKDLLPLLSGIFLGSLGFVLGYYFKKGEES